MERSTVDRLVARAAGLKSARSSLESTWQDVEYYFGGVGGITDRDYPGEERDPLEDASAGHAARRYTMTLGSMMRPRGQKWLKPRFGSKMLNEIDGVRAWQNEAGDMFMNAINNVKSGSLMALPQADGMLTHYGVAYLLVDENVKQRRLRFRSFHVRDVYHDTDEDHEVNAIFRYYSLTPDNAVREFSEPGDSLDPKVKEAAGKQDNKGTCRFLHVTVPRYQAEDAKGSMPEVSVYIDLDNENVVRQRGFLSFPWVVPRDNVPAGWKYGYSMCMANLPDGRSLQSIAAAISDASEYTLSPPLLANDAALIGDVSLSPDGITYYDGSAVAGNRPAIERLDISGNLPVGLEEQKNRREQIMQGFMQDVFELPIQTGMNVQEILRRNEDFARLVAPITDPLLPQYNGRIGDRVADIMIAANALPQAPQAADGQEIIWEYENPISRLEDEAEEAMIDSGINRVLEVAQADPSALDEVNLPAYARHKLERSRGEKFLRDPQQVQQTRADRAEQQALQQAPADVMNAADAVGAMAGLEQQLAG